MLQLPAWLTTRPRRLDAPPSAAEETAAAPPPEAMRDDPAFGFADNADRPVIELLRPHLAGGDCLIVTGYQDFLSSLAILMREVPELAQRAVTPESATSEAGIRLRIAFGVDTATAPDPGGRNRPVTDTVRRHFLERQGLQVEDAADLQAVLAIGAIERGEIALRLFDAARAREVFDLSGDRRLHAKIVTSPLGAVAGSANFSRAGLWRNIEYADELRCGSQDAPHPLAQARIELAERIWQASTDWTDTALEILQALLRPVTAEDAVCRILAEQTGFPPWRVDRLDDPSAIVGRPALPHQVALVHEASAIAYEHGFAFVSAPPGSGKTDIGKHLAYTLSTTFRRAIGGDDSAARGGAVVVAPPKVAPNWQGATRDLHVIPNSMLSSRAHDPRDSTADADPRSVHARRLREAGVLILDESHTVTPGFDTASRRADAIEFAPPAWGVCLSATLLGNRDVDWLTHLQEKRASLFLSPPHVAEMDAIFTRELGRSQAPGLFAEGGPEAQDTEGLSAETRDELSAMLAPFLTHRQRACVGEGRGRDQGDASYPLMRFHGRPARLKPTRSQAEKLDQVVALLGQLAPGKRLTSVTMTRFGVASERRHNQNTLYARNLLNILRVSSAQALWQMRHGAIGRNLRRFEIEEAERRQTHGTDLRQADLFAGAPRHRPATPKCDELTRVLESQTLLSLDARRIDALADLQRRYRRIIFLAERVATLQIFAEALKRRGQAHDGQPHDIFVIASEHTREEEDAATAPHILRELYGHDAPSFHSIRKGTDIEAFFRAGGRKAPSGPASAFMTYQMAEGINLQSAEALVAIGLTANIRELVQGLGRIDRIDSPHAKIHYHLVDIPAGRIASDDKATRRLANYRALTAQKKLEAADSEGVDSVEILQGVFDYLRTPRVLRDNNFHDVLTDLGRLLSSERRAKIDGLRIDGLWGAELAVVPAQAPFTLLHLRGQPEQGGPAARSFAPPRLLMVDAAGTLVRNQIACARALRAAYGELAASSCHERTPSPERIRAALERLGPQISALKEWDLRPERSLSCLETLAGFLAPHLGTDPGEGDLDERLFGALSLEGLEHLSETWLRVLEPFWTRAKKHQRESFAAGGASGYLTLTDIVARMQGDFVAAQRARDVMFAALKAARRMSGPAQRPVGDRISVALVALTSSPA